MYINKMIFMEYDELSKLPTAIYDSIVSNTDYGNTEILGDTLQNIRDDFMNDESAKDNYGFTYDEFMDEIKNILGSDVVKMLLNDELDFIQVLYG